MIVQRSYRGAACHLQRRSHCLFSAAEEFVRPSGVDCDPVFSGCFAMSAARETLLSALDAYVHPLIGRGLVAAGTIASAEIVGDAAQVVIELGLDRKEHTSALQSLMRNSYAVFCLKKKKISTAN